MTTAPGRQPRWHSRGLNNGAIVGATYYGVSHLPATVSYGIGHVGTWLAYRLMRDGTRALVENLALMFPWRDSGELRELALQTYRSYARDVIDFIRSLGMTSEATRRLVGRIETTALDQAMAEGRGAIVVSGHFGNWEIAGVLVRRLTAFPLSVVARPEASPAVGRLRQKMRTTLAINTIEVRQHVETALRIRERLQKNEIVAMLIDRRLGKDSVEVSFFNRPTRFLRTPALLAAMSGAPIVPCFVFREKGGLAVECGPLIRVPADGDVEANVRDAVQQVASLLEQHVRRHPQYWYQFYPFWSGEHPSEGLHP